MILLTGGAGYVGSHIAWALHDRGDPVLVLDNLSTGRRWLLPPDLPFVAGDCGDRALVEQLVRRSGIDLVIHCAGRVSVVESMERPSLYYEENVGKSLGLLAACRAGGATRFLFSSTATVYGAPDAPLLHEALPAMPVNPYAQSKAMVERILADAAAAGEIRAAILRYFNVAGADPEGRTGQVSTESTHLIKIAAEAVVGRRCHVKVTGTDYPTHDGTGVRDYVHVADLADAHLAMVDALRADLWTCRTMNVGYGRGASVLDVLDAMDAVAGTRLERRLAPARPGDVARLVADPSRIMSELGWRPRFDDLSRIVADALAWERRLAGWNRSDAHQRAGLPAPSAHQRQGDPEAGTGTQPDG